MPTWITYLRNCSIFLAALGAGVAVIYPLFPSPEFLRSELDFFKEHKDEYDLIFLGSSVIRRGVIPKQFDARMDELGHELKSINLAIPGMRSHEVNYFLNQVLDLEPARLKWIVVELDRFSPEIKGANQLAPRMVFWHDLPQTLLAMESIQLEEGPILAQLSAAKIHSVLLGAKASSIGQGPTLVRALREDWQAQADSSLEENQGWVPFTPDELEGIGDSFVVHNRRTMLNDPGWFAAEVAALKASAQDTTSHAGFNFAALENRFEHARAAGVVLIHVIAPHLDLLPNVHHALDSGLIEGTLDYHAPTRYPELFTYKHHFDRNHLTRVGAAIWTRMLADDVAALIKQD